VVILFYICVVVDNLSKGISCDFFTFWNSFSIDVVTTSRAQALVIEGEIQLVVIHLTQVLSNWDASAFVN
jgi:hypothetical protein